MLNKRRPRKERKERERKKKQQTLAKAVKRVASVGGVASLLYNLHCVGRPRCCECVRIVGSDLAAK